MAFRFSRVDTEGPWCLSTIEQSHLLALLKKIKSLESMTLREVFSGDPGKDYGVDSIPNSQAVTRLRELELDDVTQISRIRLGGTERLYGFRGLPPDQNAFWGFGGIRIIRFFHRERNTLDGRHRWNSRTAPRTHR